jgi:hypothetical protein
MTIAAATKMENTISSLMVIGFRAPTTRAPQQSRQPWQRGGRKATELAGPRSFNFPQHL